jgi:hypothetical protein
MGAKGTAIVDFGAFPGLSDASVAVTGQAGILSTSLVEAWIYPLATSDHSADEHMVETIHAFADASTIVAGTGFTIKAFNMSEFYAQPATPGPSGFRSAATTVFGFVGGSVSQKGTRLYGKWTVAWVWD